MSTERYVVFYWSGKRIATARKAAGMNQEELAKKLGVSYQQISNWENSEKPPLLENLVSIARACEADLTWLITGEEQERVPLKPEHRALLDAYKKAPDHIKVGIRHSLKQGRQQIAACGGMI